MSLTDYDERPISHKEYNRLFKEERKTWENMIRGVIKEAAKSKIPIDFVLSDIFLVRQAEEAILNEYKHLKINKITLGRK